MTFWEGQLRIADFEWDEGNALHLELGHGLTPDEAEEVFANRPLYRRTKKKHLVAFGPTFAGRYVAIVFDWRPKGVVRVITGSAIRQAANWVRQASEVRFQTREVNEWFASSLRYGDSPDDRTSGLHVDTLALPPGGVGLLKLMSDWDRLQWLNRMRAYKLFAAIEAANFQKAPMVVAIVGPSDRVAAFDAGRCLQRVWLKVTEMGLSAHPYYVVSDLLNRLSSNGVPEQCLQHALALQDRIRAEYGHESTLHCLLRVGKPVGEIQVSGRLPLNEIMCT